MEGFFTQDQIQKMQIQQDFAGSCLDCGLYRNCRSPKMGVQNPEVHKNLIVLPKPTEEDDNSGHYLSGDSGNFLKKKLIGKGLNLKTHFAITGAVQCHIGKPAEISIEACRHRLKQNIQKQRPLNIIAFGDEAINGLLGESFKHTSIYRFRGLAIPDQEYKAWILSTFPPEFIFIKEKDYNAQAFYDHELRKIVQHIKTVKEFPVIPNEDKNVICLYHYEEIMDVLKRAYSGTDSLVLDYEATGLKPYVDGHKVVSVSLDFNGKSYSFPWQYQQLFSKDQQDMIGFQLRRIWLNDRIKKIAHNAKFEHIWTHKFFQANMANWHWCTMMGAHCQDNRQGYSGLKFQTYINFGHRPYNDEVKPYIDSHGEEFNRMDECPLNILLPYGGLDTRWCRKLYVKQMEFYGDNPKMKEAFDLFNRGSISLGNIQHNGIQVDEQYCHDAQKEIEERIELIEDRLNSSKESSLFQQHTGRPLTIKEKDYSDHDLRILFYDVLDFNTEVQTAKTKKKSVGRAVIEGLDSSFAKLILKRRKLRKIHQKLDEFIHCTYGGMMHPFFDLLIPVSYRGCIAKGSKVLAVRDFKKYPDGVPIEEIKVGDSVYCYDNDLRPVIRKVVWAGKTGHKKVIRIYWKGSRKRYGYLDLTPDHKVRLISGEWARADELDKDYRKDKSKRIPKCRVLAGHRAIGNDDRLYFTGTTVPEHRFIYSNLIGPLEDHEIVHHKDGDHSNHVKSNNHIIIKIEYLKETTDVYNLEVEEFHNFIANEICVKNSCYSANFQNIHKRDKQAKKYTRRAIIPRPGNRILESDFSGIEVCLNACYNKDPNLINYIKDPTTDMHRDTACELFMLPKEEIEKMIRFYAKNMWVFAQFYGSWYKECAKNLWGTVLDLKTNSGFTIKDHLKSKGIFSLEHFINHCKKVEESFWGKRFKVYDQWKKDVQKEYQENGFTETYLGFRFSQLMTKNEITNYKAQGTGFHCLLWTLIQVEDTMVKEDMKSLLIGQIHDSIITDLHPDEEKKMIQIIDHWGTKMIKKQWRWINVPLRIDHEITGIDETWYDLKGI